MFSYKAPWVWLAGAALVCSMTWIFAGNSGNSHLSNLTCNKCHLAGKEVDPAQAKRLVASQEVLCGVCHTNLKRVSHPSGFMPSGKLPAEFPLDWKHDMTCSTCHDVHGNRPGLLRGEKRGKGLCLSCHDKAFFDNMQDYGVSLRAAGHVVSESDIEDGGVDIDAVSLQCLGCHISNSGERNISMGRNGIVRHRSGSANHPIGISYPATSRNHEFRPKNMVPKNIWLPNGNVGCVSCHEAYKKNHGQLIVSNDASLLCKQCHDL